MNYRGYILWGLSIGLLVTGVIHISRIINSETHPSLVDFSQGSPTGSLLFGLAVLLLFLHSLWTIGFHRGLALIVVGFVLGLLLEILGVNYGAIFGHYAYHPAINPRVMDVPLLVPVIWAGFIYGSFSIMSSFYIWLNRKAPGDMYPGIRSKLIFAGLGALLVLAIDVVMEPLQVKARNWTWLGSGQYFDIPAQNFLGWFLLVFFVLMIFLFLQEHLPRIKRRNHEMHLLLIPVLAYGLLGLTLALWALLSNIPVLAVIAVLTMLPIVIVNLKLFVRWRALSPAATGAAATATAAAETAEAGTM
jgi:putative membrane protein